MLTPFIIITCGNAQCRKRLRINEPEKFGKEVKCPCGYINPLPKATAPPPAHTGAGGQLQSDDDPTSFNSSFQPPPQPTIPGWLIVLGEQTHPQTFTLHMGLNTIGRQSRTYPADHMLTSGDISVSRPHCTVEVRLNRLGTLDFLIQDGIALPNGLRKISKAGTCINKKIQLHEQDRIYLNNGDTIQLGKTQLLLKTGYMPKSKQEGNHSVDTTDDELTVID